MPAPASIQTVDENHGVATWERTLILAWTGPPTAAAFIGVHRIARTLIEEDRGPVTCLFVIEASSPPPETVALKHLARFSKDLVTKMALAVVVAEGSGFRSALVRGVGITLTTLMPHRLPFKFVSTVDAALGLLAPHLSVSSGGTAALRQALKQLREAIYARVRAQAASI